MNKIKELTDFYMWMQENDYDHNIRARVEKKAEIYLKGWNKEHDQEHKYGELALTAAEIDRLQNLK